MKKYSCSFNRIIEADSEDEALDIFCAEMDGSVRSDFQCSEYRNNNFHWMNQTSKKL